MHQSLQKAVTRVLLPLVRLLLRHGVSHAEFSNWAKQAYVNEAAKHFGIKDKPPTVSRIAIVTGINRKEVKRIRELPSDVDTGVSKHNRAVRVITGWLQDEQFSDTNGDPAVLVYGDADNSFNQLVKLHGGDVPARAMLDELVRVGTVENNQGEVTLLQKGYVPHHSESAMLDIFSTSASDMLTTLEHNLTYPKENRLQMAVAYDQVTTEGASQFRKLSAEQAMKFLRELDQSLSPFDRDANPAVEGDGQHRVGLGIYFIEDIVKDADHDD